MQLRLYRFLLLLGGVFVMSQLLLFASTGAEAITRGYKTTDTDLRAGMVVSLRGVEAGSEFEVERATQETAAKIVGVAVNVDDSLVTVASSEAQVYIQNEGDAKVFVSDVSGVVTKGTLLAISPVNGVLMRATEGTRAVALAQQDFEAAKADTYDLADGKTRVRIGTITANLDIKSAGQQVGADPSTLSEVGKSITGKEVSELRVIISLVVFFLVMTSEGAILYGAVSSAVRSLGRNPLARDVIGREMIRVALIAVTVLCVGLAAIYALLWI